ncbi:hypothetical protein EGW08_006581, partial [Elysia chlorotica]
MAAPMDLIFDFGFVSHILKTSLISYVFICAVVYFCVVNEALPVKLNTYVEFTGKRILILTAHPDDECMFFSPAIIQLCKTSEVFILCTTSGDYYKQGELRKKELLESCRILGVADHNVQVLDNSAFLDGPNENWDFVLLADKVRTVINSFKPAHVFTFDNQGVSGHPNHISVSKVARQVVQAGSFAHGEVKLFELETVSLPRKYISFLELPFSLASLQPTFVSSVSEVLTAQKAMCAHKSQLVWF